MGSFLAAATEDFRWSVFCLTILTTLFLQILSNLANDYGDSLHGADSGERVGPSRAVQSGKISPKAMKGGIAVLAVLSFIAGISLLLVAFNGVGLNFYVFLGLGLLAILAAIYYTMGKNPYGYVGLGDVSVLVFFGMAGVVGTAYLQTGTIVPADFLPAISVGLFSVAVLNVNNMRDMESDRMAGKRSIPVRVGRRGAIVYHRLLLIVGWVTAILYTLMNYNSLLQFVYVLAIPLFWGNGLAVSRVKELKDLDPYLRQMAISTLLFVILFGVGLIAF